MSDDTGFTIDAHQDNEIEDLQRQVMDLQEDLQVRQAQEAAAREEGQRKVAAPSMVATAKNTSIFVGGCDPVKTTENDLRLFFSNCGPIRRITILKDRFTQQPRGVCYVEFETEEGMHAAVSTKDGQSLHGRPLKVAVKRENVPAAMRGGAGGPPGMMMGGYRGGMGGMPPMGGMGGGYRGRGGPMMMGGAPPGGPAAAMAAQQQMMAAQMMMMMGGGGMQQYSPYGAPRGRGGRGGPGRGAGRPY